MEMSIPQGFRHENHIVDVDTVPCGFTNYLTTAAIQCQHGNLFFMTQKIFDRHFSFIFHFPF